jgi:hypothetical protein
MKRSKFMDSVSTGALMRKKITGADFKLHKALSRLSEDFRDEITWFGPKTPAAGGDGMVVAMRRLPNDEPNPTEGVTLVFVDRAAQKGDPEEVSPDRLVSFLRICLAHVRNWGLDVYKVGAAIVDDQKIAVEPEMTAELLGLKRADEKIARAHAAAIMGAFASNPETTDVETINVAIASFVHALPDFAHLLQDGTWHRPYGDRTAYQLLKRGD